MYLLPSSKILHVLKRVTQKESEKLGWKIGI
jgi:hypothetical protein